jgi:hypothetical protein
MPDNFIYGFGDDDFDDDVIDELDSWEGDEYDPDEED